MYGANAWMIGRLEPIVTDGFIFCSLYKVCFLILRRENMQKSPSLILNQDNIITVCDILNNLISHQTDNNIEHHNKCLQYIEEYVLKVSPQSIFKYIDTNGKNNLIIGINVEKLENIDKGLMLCGHIDVVSGKLEQFCMKVQDGKIYGRGSSDMKGAIACFLDLIPFFNTSKTPVIIALTCDEETDMQGIKDVCCFLEQNKIYPQITILGEPTENMLGLQSSGIESYNTTIYGKSAHSSQPKQGINALFVAAKLLNEIEIMTNKMCEHELYLNVGKINGGDNLALIPDKVEIEWGFRYVHNEDKCKVLSLYDTVIEKIKKEYNGSKLSTKSTCTFLGYTANKLELCDLVCNKLNIQTKKLYYTSEAGYLSECGQTVYILGPGNIKQAHTDNEYIQLSDLITYEQLLMKLVDYCSNQ